MTGIYKITSPSGKVYIGQSTNIEKRFKDYFCLRCKNQIRLDRSFKKYGVENHKFEILTLCYEEQLNELERDFQEAYNAIDKNGLNCFLTSTDSLRRVFSEETKLKMSKSHIGFKFSEESKIKMSLTSKARKITEEQIMFLQNIATKRSKPIVCTKTGTIWYSLRKCAEEHNISKSMLNNYLNGKNPNKTSLIYLEF